MLPVAVCVCVYVSPCWWILSHPATIASYLSWFLTYQILETEPETSLQRRSLYLLFPSSKPGLKWISGLIRHDRGPTWSPTSFCAVGLLGFSPRLSTPWDEWKGSVLGIWLSADETCARVLGAVSLNYSELRPYLSLGLWLPAVPVSQAPLPTVITISRKTERSENQNFPSIY